MEPLVSALLVLHRLLVERDGLLQRLVCSKHTKPVLQTQISVCLMIRGILMAFFLWKNPSLCLITPREIYQQQNTINRMSLYLYSFYSVDDAIDKFQWLSELIRSFPVSR